MSFARVIKAIASFLRLCSVGVAFLSQQEAPWPNSNFMGFHTVSLGEIADGAILVRFKFDSKLGLSSRVISVMYTSHTKN